MTPARARAILPAGLMLGVLLATLLVIRTSDAAFMGTTANPSSSFSAGTVAVSDNDSGTAVFNTTAMLPGDTKTTCVRVDYTGSVTGTVRLYGTVTGSLAQYLNLTLERGTGAAGFNNCTGFTSSATVYTGTASGFATSHTTWTNGAGSYSAASSSNQWFRFIWTLQDNNSAQGLNASATYTWEARSGVSTTNFRATTATSTVTVPAASLSPASNLVAARGCTQIPSARWIDLTWTASPSSGVNQYRIYRSVDGGPYSSVHTTTGTSWTNSGLANGTSYLYYIVAERSGTTWVSSNSNTSGATTHSTVCT